jgi:Flp pilus assembly protein TadD
MAMLVRARALDVLGDADEARKQLEAAAARAPSLVEIADRLRAIQLRAEGEAFAASGDFNKALEKFVGALGLDNEDPVAHNDTGVVLHLLGQSAGARESIQRALKLAPGLAAAHENLEQIR